MSWILGRDAVVGDVWMPEPSIQPVQAPDRLFHDQATIRLIEQEELTRPRVGFAPPAAVVVEPLLWEGDQA